MDHRLRMISVLFTLRVAHRNLAEVSLRMGQSTSSTCKDLLPNTVDEVQYQIKKHSKILSELNDLSFEQFQECLRELNEL